MDLLVELITKDGKKIYEEVNNIRSVVVYSDRTNKPEFQINKDLSITKPPIKPKDKWMADYDDK